MTVEKIPGPADSLGRAVELLERGVAEALRPGADPEGPARAALIGEMVEFIAGHRGEAARATLGRLTGATVPTSPSPAAKESP